MATGRVPTTANSPLTAKGDLFTYSTAPARLAVGNDGEQIVADSSTSTGLRYQGNFAAGKNKIINGDFGIWQRGTSFSSPVSGSYLADRYYVAFDGSPTVTYSRQTFTPGTAPVAGYEGVYFFRAAMTATSTTTSWNLFQRIENVQTFAGQTVTVSFWAKADSARSVSMNFLQEFGSAGSGSVFGGAGQGNSVTTSWQRFSYTLTLPSISGKTIGTGSSLTLYITLPISSTSTIDLWGVQVEGSNTVTAFQTATGTIQGELATCQRYFRIVKYGILGACVSTTTVQLAIYHASMRTAPTLSVSAAVQISDMISSNSTQSSGSVSSIAADTEGTWLSLPNYSGLTSGRPATLNSSTGIALSSEL